MFGWLVGFQNKKSDLYLENNDNEYKLLISSHEPQSVFQMLKWRGPKTVREVKRQKNCSMQTAFLFCMCLPPLPPSHHFWDLYLRKLVVDTSKSNQTNWLFNQLCRLPIHMWYYTKTVVSSYLVTLCIQMLQDSPIPLHPCFYIYKSTRNVQRYVKCSFAGMNDKNQSFEIYKQHFQIQH